MVVVSVDGFKSGVEEGWDDGPGGAFGQGRGRRAVGGRVEIWVWEWPRRTAAEPLYRGQSLGGGLRSTRPSAPRLEVMEMARR